MPIQLHGQVSVSIMQLVGSPSGNYEIIAARLILGGLSLVPGRLIG